MMAVARSLLSRDGCILLFQSKVEFVLHGVAVGTGGAPWTAGIDQCKMKAGVPLAAPQNV